MSVHIKEFTIDKYNEVVSLWKLCRGIYLSEADSRENIRRYLGRNPGMSFVAQDNGVIVGAIL